MADEAPPPSPAPAPAPAPTVDAAKLQARIAELEGASAATVKELEAAKKKQGELEADAALGRTAREQMVARVEAAKKSLPEDQQKLIDAQPNLDLKTQLVDVLTKSKAAPPTPPGPGGAPPPAADKIDIKKLFAAGATVDDVMKKFPAEYAAYASSFLPPPRMTSFARQQADRNAKKKV